jgi:CheY-like chemotaxis protein
MSLPQPRNSQVQVLVVDDQIVVRHLFVLQLDKLGIKADSAADGLEALSRVQSGKYQIIFMDIQMPGMDGLQATAAIRLFEKEKRLGRIPIVAVTAGGTSKEFALKAGMDDYIMKPVKIEQVEMVLSQWAPEVLNPSLDRLLGG